MKVCFKVLFVNLKYLVNYVSTKSLCAKVIKTKILNVKTNKRKIFKTDISFEKAAAKQQLYFLESKTKCKIN